MALPPASGRRQLAQRLLGPLGRLLGVVEVEVDAIEGARAAQRCETLVDRLAGGAELRVGGVPEGEDGKAHAFDARRSIAHQRGVEVDGAARRIAFAPGGGEHDQVLGLRQHGKVGVGEVDDLGIEAMLLGELLGAHGQGFGVAALAGIENGQRLARLRRHRRLRQRTTAGLRRLEAGEKAGEPGTLLRRRAGDDAVERINVFRRERRVLRKQRLGGHKRLLDISRLVQCAKFHLGRKLSCLPQCDRIGLQGFAGADALRVIYFDFIRPRQSGAFPSRGRRRSPPGRGCRCRLWRGRRTPAPSPERARWPACRSRR